MTLYTYTEENFSENQTFRGENFGLLKKNVGLQKLTKGGTIEIRCPWLRVRAPIFFLRLTWENVKHILWRTRARREFS